MEEKNPNQSRVDAFRKSVSEKLHKQVNTFNEAFNRMSLRSKRMALIVFGVIAGTGALILMITPFVSQRNLLPKADRISTPTDIYQENPMKHNEAQQLLPIGKMKGEIDGKFEAFYIALDHEGKIFINRDPPYGEERFMKSSGWEAISNEQFRTYEKQLHFIPHKQKGLTP